MNAILLSNDPKNAYKPHQVAFGIHIDSNSTYARGVNDVNNINNIDNAGWIRLLIAIPSPYLYSNSKRICF